MSDWSSWKIWPVSWKLQAVENDLTQAIKDVTVALSALENMRSEAGFQKIFTEASQLDVAYIGIKSAFDSVDRVALWKALRGSGMPPFLLQLIRDLHT